MPGLRAERGTCKNIPASPEISTLVRSIASSRGYQHPTWNNTTSSQSSSSGINPARAKPARGITPLARRAPAHPLHLIPLVRHALHQLKVLSQALAAHLLEQRPHVPGTRADKRRDLAVRHGTWRTPLASSMEPHPAPPALISSRTSGLSSPRTSWPAIHPSAWPGQTRPIRRPDQPRMPAFRRDAGRRSLCLGVPILAILLTWRAWSHYAGGLGCSWSPCSSW